MTFFLNYANGLWAAGHFYAAVLVFLPFQVAFVMAHNFGIYATLVIGNSMGKAAR